jgi:hypothetical protein
MLDAIGVLVDHPIKESLGEHKMAARRFRRPALFRVDDRQHVEIGDLADRLIAPCRDQHGAHLDLDRLAPALARKLVGDKNLGDGAE